MVPGLAPAQGLEVDLAVICAPCPASLRVRTRVKKPAVGVAPQCSDGMEREADHFIQIFLLRIIAIQAMRGDARRQAMPMLTSLLLVEVNTGFCRLGPSWPLRPVASVRRRASRRTGG